MHIGSSASQGTWEVKPETRQLVCFYFSRFHFVNKYPTLSSSILTQIYDYSLAWLRQSSTSYRYSCWLFNYANGVFIQITHVTGVFTIRKRTVSGSFDGGFIFTATHQTTDTYGIEHWLKDLKMIESVYFWIKELKTKWELKWLINKVIEAGC